MADTYTWQVTGQATQTQFDPAGGVTTGKDITFQIMPTGYTGTLFVPDIIYQNPEAVKEKIQAEVDSIMAVHSLSG